MIFAWADFVNVPRIRLPPFFDPGS
jgi:hypothetical protein